MKGAARRCVAKQFGSQFHRPMNYGHAPGCASSTPPGSNDSPKSISRSYSSRKNRWIQAKRSVGWKRYVERERRPNHRRRSALFTMPCCKAGQCRLPWCALDSRTFRSRATVRHPGDLLTRYRRPFRLHKSRRFEKDGNVRRLRRLQARSPAIWNNPEPASLPGVSSAPVPRTGRASRRHAS